MNENKENEIIENFTIEELSAKKFKIPLYQREYTWQSDEVLTLIEDLKQTKKTRYYIGNIVVDKDNNVIDGQQRLTTLYLMLMVCNKNLLFELDYEIRDEDNAFLKAKDYENKNLDLCKNENMRENLIVILQNKDRLTEELLNKISFTITTLPPDTDITRYFELINSRGVQLEKHQILKAKFLSCLSQDEAGTFGTIWEFCANMDYFLEDMVNYKNNDKETKIRGIRDSFIKFIKNPICENIPNLFSSIEYNDMPDSVDEYKSIISFDYLLINALKCFDGAIDKNFALSNLNLLDAFGKNFKYEKAQAEKVKNFILHLLKFRIIFDYFIFKRDKQDKPYFRDMQDINFNFKIDKPKELQMIELLFYFTAENYKAGEWVQYIFECINTNLNSSENLTQTLINALETKDRKKAKKRLEDEKNKNQNKCFLDQGTSTPHYWFYRLEYLLWKNACNEIENLKEGYYLTRLNSVEHIQPQSRANDNCFNDTTINEFGNLALLTQSRNSSLNASDPTVKKAMVESWINNNKNIQSLKMLLALKGERWTYEECQNHGKEMKDLLLEDLEK